MSQKLTFSGRVTSVQPRIRLTRSFDQRQHEYLGYALGIHGTIGEKNTADFRVGIGEAAQVKHAFQVGDEVTGECEPVADARGEPVEYYKVGKLAVLERSTSPLQQPPPWHGPAPAISVYVRRRVLVVHVGLSHGRRANQGSLEAQRRHHVPDGDVLLRAEVVRPVRGRTQADGAGSARHEMGRGGLGGRGGDGASRARRVAGPTGGCRRCHAALAVGPAG